MNFDGEVFVFRNLVEIQDRFFLGGFVDRFCSLLFDGRFFDNGFNCGSGFFDRGGLFGRSGIFGGDRFGCCRGFFRGQGLVDREFGPEFVLDGGEKLLELFLGFGDFFALRLNGVVHLLDGVRLFGDVRVQGVDGCALFGKLVVEALDGGVLFREGALEVRDFFALGGQLSAEPVDFVNLDIQRFCLGGHLVFAGGEGRLAFDQLGASGFQEHVFVLQFGLCAGKSLF